MKLKLVLLALVFIAAQLAAQAKPPAPPPSKTDPQTTQQAKATAPEQTPQFSEAQKAHILLAYHKALEAQDGIALAQLASRNASDALSQIIAQELKAAGMPAGTQVNVDITKDAVTPVPPGPKR